jgi:hypothetical protein
MVSEELDVKINEFTVSGIGYQNLFAHKWYVGTDVPVNGEQLRILIDEKLKILNDDYRVERTSALKEIFVEVVPLQYFYEYLESKGKLGAQNKFPRVIKQQQMEEWENFIGKRKAEAIL